MKQKNLNILESRGKEKNKRKLMLPIYTHQFLISCGFYNLGYILWTNYLSIGLSRSSLDILWIKLKSFYHGRVVKLNELTSKPVNKRRALQVKRSPEVTIKVYVFQNCSVVVFKCFLTIGWSKDYNFGLFVVKFYF